MTARRAAQLLFVLVFAPLWASAQSATGTPKVYYPDAAWQHKTPAGGVTSMPATVRRMTDRAMNWQRVAMTTVLLRAATKSTPCVGADTHARREG